MAIILGIESSCDDTAAAVCIDGKIVSNIVSSQLKHAEYGGVIPELASRLHQVYIAPVVEKALKEAGLLPQDIDAVAYTAGPGLIGALLVGANFAKGLALALDKPMLAVNHLHGHLHSVLIEPRPMGSDSLAEVAFPFLCLTVSGGHTQLTLLRDYFDLEIIGRTIDDAAGEAFDKTAKLLGFDYPGGPLIDKHARGGNVRFHDFPKPKADGFNFTFSGLKTSVLYYLRDRLAENPQFIQENLSDICASVQHRIVTFLLEKTFAAAQAYGVKQIGIAGGVSANSYLRAMFEEGCRERGLQGFIPPFVYCTDNAAMVAFTGYQHYLRQEFAGHYQTPFAS